MIFISDWKLVFKVHQGSGTIVYPLYSGSGTSNENSATATVIMPETETYKSSEANDYDPDNVVQVTI